MLWLAALLVQSLANSPEAKVRSVAAVQAFIEGCERGALRLPASRGRLIDGKDVPPWAEYKAWNAQDDRRIIQFVDPPQTYLTIIDFKRPQPKGIVKSCVMLSRVIRSDEARYALIHSAPDIQPVQAWSANMYWPQWSVDLPKKGYRKRLRFLDDRTVLLQVDTYNPAPR